MDQDRLRGQLSAPDFDDLKAQSRSFQAMSYYAGGETIVTLGTSADYASVFRITPGVIALVASILFGLAPALQASRVQLVDGLRQGGKGSAIGARGGWARNAFVVAEIALGRRARGRRRTPGAESRGADRGGHGILARPALAPAHRRAGALDRGRAARDGVLPRSAARAAGVAGVTSIAGVTSPPTAVGSNGGYWVQGGPRPDQTGVRAPQAIFNVVTPGYFKTIDVPLRAGRDFADGDRRGASFVAIINEALARESFAGKDPIGQQIQCGLDTLEFMTIVGVVADVRTRGPASAAQSEIYMPYEQHPGPATALTLVARPGQAGGMR